MKIDEQAVTFSEEDAVENRDVSMVI